jgi:hypothetical protein
MVGREWVTVEIDGRVSHSLMLSVNGRAFSKHLGVIQESVITLVICYRTESEKEGRNTHWS